MARPEMAGNTAACDNIKGLRAGLLGYPAGLGRLAGGQ